MCNLHIGVSSDNYEPLIGRWVRDIHAEELTKEIFKGNMIEVFQKNSNLNGILISISSITESYGYNLGDVKWKNIEKRSTGHYIASGLVMTYSRRTDEFDVVNYVVCYIDFVSEDIITVQTSENGIHFVGKKQRWLRVPMM